MIRLKENEIAVFSKDGELEYHGPAGQMPGLDRCGPKTHALIAAIKEASIAAGVEFINLQSGARHEKRQDIESIP